MAAPEAVTQLPDAEKAQLVDAILAGDDAPTVRQLAQLGVGMSISCPACSNIRAPHKLVPRLIAAGRADEPIDRLVFRCDEHKEFGKPWVSIRLYGRDWQRLWPRP